MNDTEEEKCISIQQKASLLENNALNKKNDKSYNFSYPTAQIDELTGQFDLFKQILNSSNKNFNKLMSGSESENSI